MSLGASSLLSPVADPAAAGPRHLAWRWKDVSRSTLSSVTQPDRNTISDVSINCTAGPVTARLRWHDRHPELGNLSKGQFAHQRTSITDLLAWDWLPPSPDIILYPTLKRNQDWFLQDIKTWNVFGLDMHSLPEASDPSFGSDSQPQSLYRMAALFETFCDLLPFQKCSLVFKIEGVAECEFCYFSLCIQD